MLKACPHCSQQDPMYDSRTLVNRIGFFRRKSDCRYVQRFRCKRCRREFSHATDHPAFGQNKRQVNDKLRKLICSGVSLRRSARLLHVSRTTIDRKLKYLGQQAKLQLAAWNMNFPPAEVMEFDDLETFEHTKCKPLSIALAVESGSRRILGFAVARMPAKGKLVHIAMKKYGPRVDERSGKRRELFENLRPLITGSAKIKSDQNPHYPADVKRAFPDATHETHKGKRGSTTGQGELKKTRFDPLFSLNHTCAMSRANMNRLFRRTWCTTKVPERLADHFAIYAVYHNSDLI